jgi:Amt family ammonium transporter
MLWGYPSSPNPEYAAINPLGNLLGALIMCGVLGFIPGFVVSKILKGFNMLRIPPEIEIAGLDISFHESNKTDEQLMINAEIEYVNKMS